MISTVQRTMARILCDFNQNHAKPNIGSDIFSYNFLLTTRFFDTYLEFVIFDERVDNRYSTVLSDASRKFVEFVDYFDHLSFSKWFLLLN